MDNSELKGDVVSSIMERPVRFKSRGKNLFGIFHDAANNSKKVGVIFLNAGLQYRVGPHRIYVKTAREFSQIGISSLRMDFSGIGDSEGEILNPHFDCFDIEDTMRAIDFLTKKEMIEKVILLGLCAGARNALETAATDIRIDSTIFWSLPFYAPPNTPTGRLFPDSLSSTDAKHHLRQWTRKALSIKLLINYLSSHKNKNLPSVVMKVFHGLIVGEKNLNDTNRYREFFEAFELFLSSKRKALFVHGERDIVLKTFEKKFKELSDDKRCLYECYIVPNGDHTFTSLEAEKAVIEKTAEWLVQQYGLETKKEQRNLICPI
jgi:pimeloyl-ACP methyl ester carboxylesterase